MVFQKGSFKKSYKVFILVLYLLFFTIFMMEPTSPSTTIVEINSRPHLSAEKCSCIYTLLQEGHSTRVIAYRENVSQRTIIKVRQNFVETGIFANRPKSGRPRVVLVHYERKMLRLITSGKCSTVTNMQARLQ